MIIQLRCRVNRFSLLLIAGVGCALAGCSSGLLGGLGGGKGSPDAQQQIPVGNQLALPPDLALRPPGAAVSQDYQPNQSAALADDSVYGDAPAATPSRVAAVPKGTQGDIYEQYGVSKLKADGTKKSDWELRQELRTAVVAKKRQQNPKYGTIFNAGELFQDN
jgi:hypothetical protein